MCIGIYKPAGVAFLDEETYHRCWTKNSDGAGIAIWRGDHDKWEVLKGMMTWESWLVNYNAFIEHDYMTADDQVMFHFRIGSSGPRTAEGLTHPFPVVDNYEAMRQLNFFNRELVMHNGTIGKGGKDYSDTMWATKDFVHPMRRFTYTPKGKLKDEDLQYVLETCLESGICRWCVAIGPNVHLYGPWKENEGTYFTNEDYKAPSHIRHHRGANHNRAGGGPVRTVYRTGTIKTFMTKSMGFDWGKWNREGPYESNKETIIVDAGGEATLDTDKTTNKSDNADKTAIDASDLIMAVVDDDGNLQWADDPVDSDLIFCPACGSDDTMHNDARTEGGGSSDDIFCVNCEALFDGGTGTLIDEGKVGEDEVYCMYCGGYVRYDKEANTCNQCQAIIDPQSAGGSIR